jgi:hypothetical protein
VQGQSFRIKTQTFQDFPGNLRGNDGVVITNLVMALSQLSAPDKDAIGSRLEGGHDKDRIHPAGTHDADGPEMGRVLKAGHPRGVCRGIAAPLTEKP